MADRLLRERVRQCQRIRNSLVDYFPELLAVAGDMQNLGKPFFSELWKRAPAQAAARKLRRSTLMQMMKRYGATRIAVEQVFALFREEPRVVSPGATATAGERIRTALTRVKVLSAEIARAEEQMTAGRAFGDGGGGGQPRGHGSGSGERAALTEGTGGQGAGPAVRVGVRGAAGRQLPSAARGQRGDSEADPVRPARTSRSPTIGAELAATRAYLLAGRVVRWEKVSAYHRKLKAEGKKPARRYRSIADQQFRVRCAMVRTRTCFDPDSLAGGPPPDDALTSRAGGSSPPPSANSQMPAVGRGGRACAPQLRRGTPPLDLTGTPARFPRFPTAPRNPPSSSLHSRRESIGRTGRRSRGRAVKESSYMRFRPPAAGCADLQVGIAARRRSETGTAAPGNGAASPVRRTGWGSPSLPIRNDCAEETAPPNTLSHVDGDVPHPQPDAPRTPRNHPPPTPPGARYNPFRPPGRGSVWQSTWFGIRGSQVQILPPRRGPSRAGRVPAPAATDLAPPGFLPPSPIRDRTFHLLLPFAGSTMYAPSLMPETVVPAVPHFHCTAP